MKKLFLLLWAIFLSACSGETGTPTATPWVANANLPGEIIYLDGWEDGMYLCLILPDRSNLRCDPLGEALVINFTWALDGSRVAYQLQPLTGEFTEIWVAEPADLTSAQKILGPEMYYPTAPALSADGRWLVVEAQPLEGGPGDLYKVDLTATSTVAPLVAANTAYAETTPDFSPVSTRLIFASSREEVGTTTLKIYSANLDGGDLQRLTPAEGQDSYAPSWSPDGKQIAYYNRDAHSQNANIDGLYVMDADGSNSRLVTPVSHLTLDLEPPVWSPDGKWLAYLQHEQGGGGEWINPQVWVVSVEDASGDGAPLQLSQPGTTNFLVSWSPDSRALLYTQRTENDYFLYMVKRDGSDKQKFIECTLCAFGTWSPR